MVIRSGNDHRGKTELMLQTDNLTSELFDSKYTQKKPSYLNSDKQQKAQVAALSSYLLNLFLHVVSPM